MGPITTPVDAMAAVNVIVAIPPAMGGGASSERTGDDLSATEVRNRKPFFLAAHHLFDTMLHRGNLTRLKMW